MNPSVILGKVTSVLGTIDLDPASDAVTNEAVGAIRYYQDDGLTRYWSGPNIYLNPPSGESRVYWAKLQHEYEINSFDSAIFMCDSLEYDGGGRRRVLSPGHHLCVPSRRIAFPRAGQNSVAPSHSSVIVLVSRVDAVEQRFLRVFGEIGSTW